jgi:hypothetical protein
MGRGEQVGAERQADIFMETYTESELRELVKFYRTPIGKKAIQTLPEITRKGIERGTTIGQSLIDSPKVQKMINDKFDQLKAEGKLPKNL